MADSGLRRELGLSALTVYGIGGMLGGGIYALVGEVAGLAGAWCWLAFLVAMLVAAPTAFSYAELASRHPKSGGESWYCQVAFGGRVVPFLVGWLVLVSGVVSMAALSHAFAGYVRELAPAAPAWALAVAFLVALAGVNLRGIRIASTANVVCTVVEASGLVFVIAVGAVVLFGSGAPGEPAARAATDALEWTAVLQGAALAFYAFIGFEDMVNVAEEVRRPERAYPVAVPVALLVVGAIYAAVAFVATRTVPVAELAASDAPLTRVVDRGVAVPAWTFTLVAVFAVANTALLNFVTASRLAFGMAREAHLPRSLGAVHASWGTPHRAIACILVLAAAVTLAGDLGVLAGATSFVLLVVFFAVNLALVVDRKRRGDAPVGPVRRSAPLAGMFLSLALVPFLPVASVLTSLPVIAVGGVVFLGLRRTASGS